MCHIHLKFVQNNIYDFAWKFLIISTSTQSPLESSISDMLFLIISASLFPSLVLWLVILRPSG